MKQKDIAVLMVVVFVSIVVSIFASKMLFSSPKNREQQVPVVPAISANFPVPSSQFFNSQSVDPTQLIQIGNSTNPQPFNTPTNQ